MRLSGLLRRARRLGVIDIWSSLYTTVRRTFPDTRSTSKPRPGKQNKHIKIDDEESQFDDEPLFTLHSPGRPLYKTMRLILLTLLAILLLLLVLAYMIYYPPNLLIRFLQWKNPRVIFHVPLPSSQRVVALTLDDAPSSETGKILDLLKLHGAKATFFIIGSQVSPYKDIIQRIHDEGHELGNHAMFDSPSFALPLSELERQIGEVEALLPKNGNGMKYFRPGSGWFNRGMRERVEGMGYRVALGSVYPHDPQIPFPGVNARHVLGMVRSGSVVIMHDRRGYSVEQLRLVLEGLGEKGFRVESLGGLLAVGEEGKKKVG